VSYPPPSTPGQPPPYGQQPQYGQPGSYPPPQQRPDEDEQRRRSKKKKYTAAGVLGVAASIATIITLFITLDQQPQPNNGPNGNNATTPANAYPINVQSNFLNSCETTGTPSVCQCSLSWFEQHVSLAQFEQDELDVAQGGQPVDVVSVRQTCG